MSAVAECFYPTLWDSFRDDIARYRRGERATPGHPYIDDRITPYHRSAFIGLLYAIDPEYTARHFKARSYGKTALGNAAKLVERHKRIMARIEAKRLKEIQKRMPRFLPE